ncbi:MAG: hypothetical protein ACI8UO_002700 [Verrucomicrobiales bacterium]
MKFDIVIHQRLPVFEWSKSDPHSFSHDKFFCIEPSTPGDELSGLAGADGLDFFQFYPCGVLTFPSRSPIPEIDTVHVTVRKTKRAMMGMILAFMLNAFLHGIVPRDVLSVGSHNRVKVRSEPVRVPPFREEFPVDLDADAIFKLGDSDIGERGGAGCEGCDEEGGFFHGLMLASSSYRGPVPSKLMAYLNLVPFRPDSIHDPWIVLPRTSAVTLIQMTPYRPVGIYEDISRRGIPEDQLFAIVAAEVGGDRMVEGHPVNLTAVRGRQPGQRRSFSCFQIPKPASVVKVVK